MYKFSKNRAIIPGLSELLDGYFMLLLPLAKLFCQGDYLPDQFGQLQRLLRQFVEKSQRFLLSVDGVNGLHALVVIHACRPELGVKLGQPDVKIVGVLVLRDDRKISAEYPGTDEIGGGAGLRSAEHGQEFLVVGIVQLNVITVRPGIGEDFAPRRIADLLVVLHNCMDLEVRLGRTAPAFRIRFGSGFRAAQNILGRRKYPSLYARA